MNSTSWQSRKDGELLKADAIVCIQKILNKKKKDHIITYTMISYNDNHMITYDMISYDNIINII